MSTIPPTLKKNSDGYSNVPHLELLILKDFETLTLKASANNTLRCNR